MTGARWRSCAALLWLCAAAAGCGRGERARPAAAAADAGRPGAGAAAPASAPGAAAGERRLALLDEAARAEVDAGGLFIDLGTADEHKFTRGGWQSGWGRDETAPDGVTAAAATEPAARLIVALEPGAAAREVAVRARSAVAGQRVELALDGAALGGGAVGPAWTVVTAPIPPEQRRGGWRALDLRFAAAGPAGDRALVDWVWLRGGAAATAPPVGPRVVSLRFGDRARRALVASAPRRTSFYLQLPAGATLVFDYGARAATTFVVRATEDGAPPRELFRAAAAAGQWRRGEVDLGALAGRAVRLDLVTEGPAGPAGWGEPEIVAPAPAERPTAGPKPRSVIVVVLDATRADAVRAFDPRSRVETPALTALAAESTAMLAASANAPWTKPSVTSMLSGVRPHTHGMYHRAARIPDGLPLLNQELKAQGFATALFSDNPYYAPQFGFDRGWDRFRNLKLGPGAPAPSPEKIAPARIFAEAREWALAQRGGRFFLWIHTLGAHAPLKPWPGITSRYHPAPYTGPLGQQLTLAAISQINEGTAPFPVTDAERAWMRALYDGEVTREDQQLGEFVAALRRDGLLEDTLLVVTNDHGEEVFDHGKYGHALSLYEELLRMPLLLRYPARLPRGGRVAALVESIDLAPTVLDVLGLPAPPPMEGVSFLPLVGGAAPAQTPFAVAEQLLGHDGRSVRVGRYKLIVIGDRLVPRPGGDARANTAAWSMPPGLRLFDLEADPGERRDRSAELPIARRLCEIYLGEALAVAHKGRRGDAMRLPYRCESRGATLDPQLRRQLEALGYLAD
jgi:arylsulfatase A-like enzyme